MKRLGVSFKNSFFIFLLLGAAACVTFRPAARASGPEVETFITCRAVATQGRLLEAVTAFDRLDLAADPASRPAGVWTVVLFVEETLAEQTVFTIMLKK